MAGLHAHAIWPPTTPHKNTRKQALQRPQRRNRWGSITRPCAGTAENL
jgi:hypothetical protein